MLSNPPAKYIALAACDPKGIMASQGALPWHLPEDLDHFYQMTDHQVVIMGYKTYLSIPPNRFKRWHTLVLTRQHREAVFHREVTPISSLEELARHYTLHPDLLRKRNFVVGGAEVFKLFFAHQWIQTVWMTHVKKEYVGDVLFPLDQIKGWSCTLIKENEAFVIKRYEKP